MSFWHPLSAVYLDEPPVPASPAILTLQWLASRWGGRPAAWGDSHTRWLDGSGRLGRSFVHVFTPRARDAELRVAGFSPSGWAGGHGLYR